MRPRTSKYERELKSEERRALIWLGLLAVIVAFYFWLRDSDPNAAPYINFFCNSPCPHITLYWIPFLQALIYYWIGYAGCMLIYFSEDFFHRWGVRGRIFRQGARSIGQIFLSLYPVTVLTITVLAAISFFIPAPIQLPYWLLVYEFFAILAIWSIERITGRRRVVGRMLEGSFEGAKDLWRRIRGLGSKLYSSVTGTPSNMTTNPENSRRVRSAGFVSGWVMIAFVLIAFVWFRILAAGAVSSDRISAASNAIVQLDSFIVGGFIVGFFYLWERLEKHWQKRRREPGVLVVVAFPAVTIISLVFSGLAAVGAILTADLWYLGLACELLIFGLWTVFVSWYTLQHMLEEAERRKE